MRRIVIMVLFLLLIGGVAVMGAGTTPNSAWAGNYRVITFPTQHVMSVTVTWSGTTNAIIYCGVGPANPNYPPVETNASAWTPTWTVTAGTGADTYALMCDTTAVLVATGASPAPIDIAIAGGATSTPATASVTATATTATMTPVPTATLTASPLPSTSTSPPVTRTVPPTSTAPAASSPTPTQMPGMWTNTCHDLNPAEVDQHGVPVDQWAPGLRIACGFPGYENGDDPMPAGTLMPPPRPFRFDSVVDHNEPVFGFKVYYRKGSDAPPGYQDTRPGCGDIRVILHQGTEPHGFTTQFHTFQYTEVQCDTQGVPHVLDIGGQIDTGPLFLRSLPDSQRPAGPNRTTADTISCDQKTTFTCATVWYEFFNYGLPGGAQDGYEHNGMLVENPIALYNANDPMHYAPGTGDGTTIMLRDVQRGTPPFDTTKPDWCAMWNLGTQVNEVVPCSTPGSWHMHVDPWYAGRQVLEPSFGDDHRHVVAGIKYPN